MTGTSATRPRVPMTALLSSTIFFTGVGVSATWPYNAIVAIEQLGLTNSDYALLIMVSSIVAAIASVTIGWFSDRIGDRRLIIVISAAIGVLSYALLFFVRTPLAFIISIGAIMPFSGALFSQTFAYSRLYYDAHHPERSAIMVSVLRTLFSIAWAVVPPVVGIIASVYSIFDIYLISAFAYIAAGATFAVLLANGSTRIARAPRVAAGEQPPPARIAPSMIVGIAGIATVQTALSLMALALPLSIVNDLGGTLGDVGIYAGLAAGLEVPFMVMWGVLAQRFSHSNVLFVNALIMALYGALLFFAQNTIQVFALQILNGISVAAILSLSISYMQDAIKGRMGLSTSLTDVVAVASRLTSAAIFAIVAANGNYRACFIAGSAIAVIGGLTIFAAHLPRAARA